LSKCRARAGALRSYLKNPNCWVLLSCAVLLLSCGSGAAKVRQSDYLGSWLAVPPIHTSVELTLRADGTFLLRLDDDAADPQECLRGTWTETKEAITLLARQSAQYDVSRIPHLHFAKVGQRLQVTESVPWASGCLMIRL